jgi:hypothetical protein
MRGLEMPYRGGQKFWVYSFEWSNDIVAVMVQLLRAFGEGISSSRDREPAIAAILRATGPDARLVKSRLARLPPPPKQAVPELPHRNSKPRRGAGA